MKNKKSIILLIIIAVLFIAIVLVFRTEENRKIELSQKDKNVSVSGVCPPFSLYDEDGNLIDPINGINSDKPYSPRQTCGKCHDFDKITKGFHFQQGKDEKPTGIMSKRYRWVTSPGNYGGNWCSPAPIYRKLAFKKNNSAKDIDMTSFEFITATCGYCHPGGGPLEFDRDGIRYDKKMKDTINKFTAGGDNNFDGDYYKASWNETGVIEGDCMLCHVPEYNYKGRNAMLDSLNFKWAATEGSGLGKIEGSIKSKQTVKVVYDLSKFDKDSKVSMHFVREPRNETCMNCHAKPDWKKKGTDFSERRDVHIAAGLKCVDCHGAGSKAPNDLIKGKEEHQFGKGDDPSGNVRNDLDNTVKSCENCHLDGQNNAPIAKHYWLPPLHLEKIACQTCHIPMKSVKSALVQVSDVYNKGPKITPPAKHIWTFYDQNMNYWNHYGELNMFTAKDMPYDEFKPIMAKYNDKIFPVNPVHSAWPGIYEEGKEGLDQPKMKDIYMMWTAHLTDSSKYPLLNKIKDDNGDNIPEVNTPEEIDAFIVSVKEHLEKSGYDLKGKQIVWVNNDRVYKNSKEFFTIDKYEYESSPFASVYKYSHNVAPSKSALGVNGCTDCHSDDAKFFNASIVKYPFGEDGKPITEPQYTRMGLSAFTIYLGMLREEYLKPIFYSAFVLFIISLMMILGIKFIPDNIKNKIPASKLPFYITLAFILFLCIAIILYFKSGMIDYILPSRFSLDANHFLISIVNMIIGIISLYLLYKNSESIFTQKLIIVLLISSVVSGFFMIIQFNAIMPVVRYAYTIFDLSQVILILSTTFISIKKMYFNNSLNV
jgi:hypothetical protein